jgi:hypothetical protein
MRLRVKDCDVSGIAAKVEAANRAALGIAAENVLSDCGEYVPYDTGALQSSGATRQSGDKAYVEWGGDSETAAYARVQYYEAHDHGTSQNALHAPRATDHWYDHANADHGERWRSLYNKALLERM